MPTSLFWAFGDPAKRTDMVKAAVGQRLLFKYDHQVVRYGEGAAVVDAQLLESRPCGALTILVDLKTDSGKWLQWPLPKVRREFHNVDVLLSQPATPSTTQGSS